MGRKGYYQVIDALFPKCEGWHQHYSQLQGKPRTTSVSIFTIIYIFVVLFLAIKRCFVILSVFTMYHLDVGETAQKQHRDNKSWHKNHEFSDLMKPFLLLSTSLMLPPLQHCQ